MKVLVYIKKAGDHWASAIKNELPGADVRQWPVSEEHNWQADYALTWLPPAELFQQQVDLKAVFNLGVGVDHLLNLQTLPSKLPVYKICGAGMEETMSDYVTYGLMHFFRGFDRYRSLQSKRIWEPHGIENKADWSVGVLGLGTIGCSVALAIRSLGFPALGWSRSKKDIEGVEGFAGNEELDDVFRRSRVLVNLLPSTPETLKLIGDEALEKMPDGGVLINTGRGSVIDLDAVERALTKGKLRGAVLDVFEHEPLDREHRLWNYDQVIITPHIASPTPLNEAANQIATNIRMIEAGEMPSPIDRNLGY